MNARHCAACRAALKRADSHAQYRLKTGKLARENYCATVEAEVRKAVEERRRRAVYWLCAAGITASTVYIGR